MKRAVASLALLFAAAFPATAAEVASRPDGASPGFPGAAPSASTAARDSHKQASPSPMPPDTSLATLRGRVRSEQTGLPLPHVFVEALSGSLRYIAVTDEAGRYRLPAVPPGRWTVRAFSLDHAPLSVDLEVAPGGELALDLALRLRPVGLPPLMAAVRREVAGGNGDGAAGRAGHEGPERESELRALEATPGLAELGLGETAPRAGPDPVDPTSALYVRGAASDLKLVLLDGAPVFAPFHLAGLIEAFQPEVLASSRLFVGGAPARYDGGLSYILDLRTRPGEEDRMRASGAADFLSVRQRVEGPMGPGRFLVSVRGVHGSTLHEALSGAPLPYRYGDALARLDLPAGEAHRVSATAFWNREAVRLDSLPQLDRPARWGNAAGSLRYQGSVGKGDLEITAAVGLFRTRLPLALDSLRMAEAESRRMRLAADYALPAGDGLRLAFGSSYDLSQLGFQTRADGREGQALTSGSGRGESVGGYAEAIWSPMDALELRAGVRADAFATAGRSAVAPRARAAWRLADDASLFVAAGRFHQYVRAPETILGGDLDGLGTGGFQEFVQAGEESDGGRRALTVAGASHLVVGLQDELSGGLRLGLEGFLKVFDEVPGATDLRASGVDLWVHRHREDWRGWLGYSLAFVWSEEAPEESTARFAGRQILSAGLEAQLLTGMALDLRLAYGSGLPFTSIPVDPQGGPALDTVGNPEADPEHSEPPLAGAPPGSYLRVDGKLSRPWAARIAGVDVRLVPYVKVLNALDRRDALFFQFDPRQDLRPRSLAAIPLLPVVGMEWTL